MPCIEQSVYSNVRVGVSRPVRVRSIDKRYGSMAEITGKPDLIVHPNYVRPINEQYDLSAYFNVLSLDDLRVDVDSVPVYRVSDAGVGRVTLRLEPYYANALKRASGIEPAATSYWFDEDMPLYSVDRNGPRYVIWTKSDPLSVCATCVDRVDAYELYEAVRRARDWAFTIYHTKSIVVFDLDETLIDERCRELQCADRLLDFARNSYDLVVLWSHGSALHVDDNVQRFVERSQHGDSLFDLILRNGGEQRANKNLLHLYNFVPNCRFSRATLVDDSAFNWTPEYDKLVIPNCRNTLYHALACV